MTFTVYVVKLFKTFGSADRIEPHESLTFIFISATGSLRDALFSLNAVALSTYRTDQFPVLDRTPSFSSIYICFPRALQCSMVICLVFASGRFSHKDRIRAMQRSYSRGRVILSSERSFLTSAAIYRFVWIMARIQA